MDIESIREELESFHKILNPPLVNFLKKIYQSKNGKNFIILDSIEDEVSLEKIKKYKSFTWNEDGNNEGVAFDELLKVLKDSWKKITTNVLLKEKKYRDKTFDYIKEVITIRNKYCHPQHKQMASNDDMFRSFDTFYRFAESIQADSKTLEKIDLIRKELIKIVFPTSTLNADIGVNATIRLSSEDKMKSNKEEAKNEPFKYQCKGYRIEIKTFFYDSSNTQILSVPATSTLPLIQEHKIHSCPNKGKNYDYKPTRYITFRNSEGVMESIFEIKKILIVHDFEKILKESKNNFFKLIQSCLDSKKHPLENTELKRLKKYSTSEIFKTFLFFYKNNRFYILSEDVEHLSEKKIFTETRVPRTSGGGEKREELVPIYYDLSDFR